MRGVIAEGVVLPIADMGGLKRGSVYLGVGELRLLLKTNIGEVVS